MHDEREMAVHPVDWKLRRGSLVGLRSGELVIYVTVLPVEKDPQLFPTYVVEPGN